MSLSNSKRPFVAPGKHPVESGGFTIETPIITDLCDTVIDWFNNYVTGGLIFGFQRYGKTSYIRILSVVLRETFPGIVIVSFPDWKTDVANQGGFLETLLSESGHKIVSQGTLDQKRGRLVNHLVALGKNSGYDRVVLIIDEAQNLRQFHYEWLIGIYNLVERRGVKLIVLLVGQHELLSIRAGYVSAEKHEILGRFMLQDCEFRGLGNVADVRACLKEYDEGSEFPTGSGYSFTRYYLPEWYDKGGRLHHLAREFWAAFREVGQGASARTMQQLSMLYYTNAVKYVLQQCSDLPLRVRRGKKRARLSLETPEDAFRTFLEAINESGYAKALSILAKTRAVAKVRL